MNLFHGRKLRAILIGAAFVGCTGVAAAAVTGRVDAPPPAPVPPGGAEVAPAPAQAARTDPSVARSFRAFRREPTSGDRVTVDSGWARATGMNEQLARRLGASGSQVHAVPGNRVTCIVVSSGSGSCVPNEFVGKEFSVSTCGDMPTGTYGVTGMVPDGVEQAVIRLANGSTVDAPVEENLLDVQVKHEPAAVEWEDASGERTKARVAGTVAPSCG